MLDSGAFSAQNNELSPGGHSHLDSSTSLSNQIKLSLKQHIGSCFTNDVLFLSADGSYRLTVAEFNKLLTHDARRSTDPAQKRASYEQFTGLIPHMRSVDARTCNIFKLYPLLRKLFIAIEGHLLYTLEALNHDRVHAKLSALFRQNEGQCLNLDDLYATFDVIISKEGLLRGLDYSVFHLDRTLEALEAVWGVLTHTVGTKERSSALNTDRLIARLLFSGLQKLVAGFLLLEIVKSTKPADSRVSTNSAPNASKDGAKAENGNEKLIKMVLSVFKTLNASRETSVNDEWSRRQVLPIFDILAFSFALSAEAGSTHYPLVEALVTSINGTVGFLKDDSFRALKIAETLLKVYALRLSRVNSLFSDYTVSLHKKMLTATEPRGAKNEEGRSPLSKNSSSRDVSTLIQKNDLKTCLVEYTKLSLALSKLNLHWLSFLRGESDSTLFYNILESASKFVSNVVALILLTDWLEYVTRKSSKTDMVFFFRENVDRLWSLSVTVINSLPFEVVNALFYYSGSRFNNRNSLSQMYLVEAFDHTQLRGVEHSKYVRMINQVLLSSKSLFFTPVSFVEDKKAARHLKQKYLSLPFSTIFNLFILEASSNPETDSGYLWRFIFSRLLESFASWCCSEDIYEKLLARQICQTALRLVEEKKACFNLVRYLLDVVLGLCFFTNFDDPGYIDESQGDYGDFTTDSEKCDLALQPINRGQLNAFSHLRILANSALYSWLMENVQLPYTCAFVSVLRYMVSGIHDRCGCVICSFKCFQSRNGKGCNCNESLIVNGSPSVSHYQELVNALAPCRPPRQDNRAEELSTFHWNSVSAVLHQLLTVISNANGRGDLNLIATLFKVAISLTRATVGGPDFKLNDTTVSSLSMLFSLLATPEIRKLPEAEKIRLVSEVLAILHSILSRVPNDQFMDLHRRFLKMVVGKMERYPLSLVRLGFYHTNKAELAKEYGEVMQQIVERATRSGSYILRVIYCYHVWKFCRNNGLEDRARELFKEYSVAGSENDVESTASVNMLFALSRKVSELSDHQRAGLAGSSLVETR